MRAGIADVGVLSSRGVGRASCKSRRGAAHGNPDAGFGRRGRVQLRVHADRKTRGLDRGTLAECDSGDNQGRGRLAGV